MHLTQVETTTEKFSGELEMANRIGEYLNACSAADLLKLYSFIYGEDETWRKAVLQMEMGIE